MKKIIAILLLTVICLLSSVFLSSCGQLPENGSGESTMPFGEYFDWEKSHIPKVDEIYSIESGMSSTEVISLLGKPHGYGPTSGLPSLSWEADDGVTYYFIFVIEQGLPEDMNGVEVIMKHSTVIRKDNENVATMSPEDS